MTANGKLRNEPIHQAGLASPIVCPPTVCSRITKRTQTCANWAIWANRRAPGAPSRSARRRRAVGVGERRSPAPRFPNKPIMQSHPTGPPALRPSVPMSLRPSLLAGCPIPFRPPEAGGRGGGAKIARAQISKQTHYAEPRHRPPLPFVPPSRSGSRLGRPNPFVARFSPGAPSRSVRRRRAVGVGERRSPARRFPNKPIAAAPLCASWSTPVSDFGVLAFRFSLLPHASCLLRG
jgi:hypothetical protein